MQNLPQTNNETSNENPSLQQEKANKIIAEAIAKAQKSGNSAIPRVLQPPELPSTLGDLDNPEQQTPEGEKPKRKGGIHQGKKKGRNLLDRKRRKVKKLKQLQAVMKIQFPQLLQNPILVWTLLQK